MTIMGILFDKDGTLLDYGATWMPANKAAALTAARGNADLAERLMVAGGYDPARDRITANRVLAAGNNLEIAEVWQDHLPDWRLSDLLAMIDRVFQMESAAGAMPVTELAPLFERMKERGLSLGVATSDSRRGVDVTLGPFAVLDLLDFISGYDSGHGSKPDPAIVHGFCDATGLAAAEVAVVGDNLHDMHMGRSAGAGLVVGVLTGTGERDDLSAHADHVLDSIVELEALLDRI
jgi:phosphoglycolate phosphatase